MFRLRARIVTYKQRNAVCVSTSISYLDSISLAEPWLRQNDDMTALKPGGGGPKEVT